MIARPVAEIRLRSERRVFVATTCVERGQFVHAVGRWRTRFGANYTEERFSSEMSISFGATEIKRITWLEHELDVLDHGAEIARMP